MYIIKNLRLKGLDQGQAGSGYSDYYTSKDQNEFRAILAYIKLPHILENHNEVCWLIG